MIEHQEHFGRKFYQDKKTGYWISTDYPRIRAHRWVWEYHHGMVPKNCHIHHKNENKSDNRLENLEMLTFSEHSKKHMNQERSERSSKWMDKIRPLSKEWHSSDEGKAWHRYHALRCNFGKNSPRDLKCEECGNDYQTTKKSRSRFCSNACKAKSRRDSGIDDIEYTCQRCGVIFKANKYADRKFCSVACV